MGAKILLQSLVQQHQVAYKGQWVDRGLSSCLQAVLEVLLIPRLSLSWQQCRGGATRKAKLCCLHVWTRLCECLGPVEARSGYLIPWNWSYVWLWAAMWLLEFVLGSSTGAPNHWAIWPGHSVVNNHIPWAFILKYQLWLLCFHEPSGLSPLCLLLHKISVEAYSDPNISSRTLSVSSYLVLLGDILFISNRNHWLI